MIVQKQDSAGRWHGVRRRHAKVNFATVDHLTPETVEYLGPVDPRPEQRRIAKQLREDRKRMAWLEAHPSVQCTCTCKCEWCK